MYHTEASIMLYSIEKGYKNGIAAIESKESSSSLEQLIWWSTAALNVTSSGIVELMWLSLIFVA